MELRINDMHREIIFYRDVPQQNESWDISSHFIVVSLFSVFHALRSLLRCLDRS